MRRVNKSRQTNMKTANLPSWSLKAESRSKRSIASEGEDTLSTRGSFFLRNLRKFRGTLCAAKLCAPVFFGSKCLETRKSFASQPAARCRVCQD